MNKTTQKVALLDTINPVAHERFVEAGQEIGTFQKTAALADLSNQLEGAQLLGIRSGPRIPADLLNRTPELLAIGCYCVGTEQVDKQAATERGMAVFNSPFDNGRSVAELVIGATFTLLRRLHEHNRNLHAGRWSKTEAESFELKGKTMGIIGYGNIGQQVGVLAEAIGMDVIYADLRDMPRLGNAQPRTKQELLKEADVVSIHVPGGLDKPIIGGDDLENMKQGAYLINTSRAQAVDYQYLDEIIRDGVLGGAALDVFPDEPGKSGEEFVTRFRDNDKVLLTPHIGGSTQEAQKAAAATVSNKLLQYLKTGATTGAVNLPQADLGPLSTDTRLAYVHRNAPGAAAEVTDIIQATGLNIAADTLRTKADIGYALYDLENVQDADSLLTAIGGLDACIKARVITR